VRRIKGKNKNTNNIDKETDIYYYIYDIEATIEEKIGKEKAKEIIKKLEEGDDNDMWQAIEMIREENRTLRNEGRKEGIGEIIRNMIQSGMPTDEIKRFTKVSKKEIENIRASL
jgi:hypothetical protein